MPEVRLEEQVVIQIRVGSESGTNAGALEGKVHYETAHDIQEEVFFYDETIGCFAGMEVMNASTQDLPTIFACLKSTCYYFCVGPLLLVAAPG